MVGISPRQQIFLARSSFPRIFAPVPLLSETKICVGCYTPRRAAVVFAGAFAQKHSQGVGMFVADFPGDGLQGLLSCAQQVRCSFDPQILDEADGRNSQGALDGALQRSFAHANGLGGLGDADRLAETFAHPAFERRDGGVALRQGAGDGVERLRRTFVDHQITSHQLRGCCCVLPPGPGPRVRKAAPAVVMPSEAMTIWLSSSRATAPPRASTAVDPDGNQFEVMWTLPRQEWGIYERSAVVERLDLAAEFDTRSGTRTAGDILHDDPRATLLDQPR